MATSMRGTGVRVSGGNVNQPGEPNGFEDRSDCVLSWDNATRTLTLTGSYAIWTDGQRLTKGNESIQIADTEGAHFIYFDSSGTLTETTSFDPGLISEYAFVALVYWDATNSEAVPGPYCEQHGSSMTSDTHLYLHNTVGAAYDSGLAPAPVSVDGSGDDDDDARVPVSGGVFWDEDIEHTVPARLSTDTLFVLYRDGANGDWRMDDDAEYPVLKGPSRAYWNEWTGATWTLTEASNNDFVLAHLFAVPGTNEDSGRIVAVMGQAEYSTLGNARAGAEVELAQLQVDGLPTPEFVALATVIFQTGNGYANAVASRVRSTDAGDDFIDWRTQPNPGGGAVAVAWGDITGTLTNQVDLAAAFDALVAHGSYTPTLSGISEGATGTNEGWYTFVGGPDSADEGILTMWGEVELNGTTGGDLPDGNNVTIGLPSGFEIDADVQPTTIVGDALTRVNAANVIAFLWKNATNVTSVRLLYGDPSPGSYLSVAANPTATTPRAWGDGDAIRWYAKIPAVRT